MERMTPDGVPIYDCDAFGWRMQDGMLQSPSYIAQRGYSRGYRDGAAAGGGGGSSSDTGWQRALEGLRMPQKPSVSEANTALKTVWTRLGGTVATCLAVMVASGGAVDTARLGDLNEDSNVVCRVELPDVPGAIGSATDTLWKATVAVTDDIRARSYERMPGVGIGSNMVTVSTSTIDPEGEVGLPGLTLWDPWSGDYTSYSHGRIAFGTNTVSIPRRDGTLAVDADLAAKRDRDDLRVYRKARDCWTWEDNPGVPGATTNAPADFLAFANSPGSDPIYFFGDGWWGANQFWPDGRVKYQKDFGPGGTGDETNLVFAFTAYDRTGTNALYRFGATARRTDPYDDTLVTWSDDRFNQFVRIATTDAVEMRAGEAEAYADAATNGALRAAFAYADSRGIDTNGVVDVARGLLAITNIGDVSSVFSTNSIVGLLSNDSVGFDVRGETLVLVDGTNDVWSSAGIGGVMDVRTNGVSVVSGGVANIVLSGDGGGGITPLDATNAATAVVGAHDYDPAAHMGIWPTVRSKADEVSEWTADAGAPPLVGQPWFDRNSFRWTAADGSLFSTIEFMTSNSLAATFYDSSAPVPRSFRATRGKVLRTWDEADPVWAAEKAGYPDLAAMAEYVRTHRSDGYDLGPWIVTGRTGPGVPEGSQPTYDGTNWTWIGSPTQYVFRASAEYAATSAVFTATGYSFTLTAARHRFVTGQNLPPFSERGTGTWFMPESLAVGWGNDPTGQPSLSVTGIGRILVGATPLDVAIDRQIVDPKTDYALSTVTNASSVSLNSGDIVRLVATGSFAGPVTALPSFPWEPATARDAAKLARGYDAVLYVENPDAAVELRLGYHAQSFVPVGSGWSELAAGTNVVTLTSVANDWVVPASATLPPYQRATLLVTVTRVE